MTTEGGSPPGSDGGPASIADGSGPPVTLPDGSAPLPPRCWPGTATPCLCEDGREGLLYCQDGRWANRCECAPIPMPPRTGADGGRGDAEDGGSASGHGADGGSSSNADGGPEDPGVPCTGDPEWCDGYDNDCDGVVDEGHPCADPTVQNTLPFSGSVYLAVSPAGDVTDTELRPLWPDPTAPRIGELDAISSGTRWAEVSFRRDGVVVYGWGGSVLYERRPSAPDVEIPTPPCFDRVGPYGFDASGEIYYACPASLRRGAGELLLEGLQDLGYPRAVSDAGRVFLLRDDYMGVVDTDGSVLGTEGVGEWVGRLRWGLAVKRQFVVGEHAFFAIARTYRGRTRDEVVIFRIHLTDGSVRLVRRVPVGAFPDEWLPLPDGRLFARYDHADGSRILEYPPRAPARRVWPDGDESARGWQLVARF